MKYFEIIEKFPSIAILFTSFFLTLSFVYNTVYFMTFELDISMLPLTVADYSLTVTSFITVLILSLLSASFPIKNTFDKINSISRTRDTSYPQNIFLVCGIFLFISIVLIVVTLYLISIKYIFHQNFLACFFIIFCISFSVVIFIYRANLLLNFKFLLIFFMIIFPYFYVANVAQKKALSSFMSKENILITVKKIEYNILRTFEKGVLVKNDDLSISFVFYSGDSNISFEKNKKLIEFYEIKNKISKL